MTARTRVIGNAVLLAPRKGSGGVCCIYPLCAVPARPWLAGFPLLREPLSCVGNFFSFLFLERFLKERGPWFSNTLCVCVCGCGRVSATLPAGRECGIKQTANSLPYFFFKAATARPAHEGGKQTGTLEFFQVCNFPVPLVRPYFSCGNPRWLQRLTSTDLKPSFAVRRNPQAFWSLSPVLHPNRRVDCIFETAALHATIAHRRSSHVRWHVWGCMFEGLRLVCRRFSCAWRCSISGWRW